jgi:hypothetical protein
VRGHKDYQAVRADDDLTKLRGILLDTHDTAYRMGPKVSLK